MFMVNYDTFCTCNIIHIVMVGQIGSHIYIYIYIFRYQYSVYISIDMYVNLHLAVAVCLYGGEREGCSRCEFLWDFLPILFLLIFHDYQSTRCMHLLNMHTSTLFIYFNFRWKIKLNSVYNVAWFYNHCSTNFPTHTPFL